MTFFFSSCRFDQASTESLKSLVSNIPLMNEKKRIIDMHMNIATSLLRAIKERQIDFFVQFEETLLKQVTPLPRTPPDYVLSTCMKELY